MVIHFVDTNPKVIEALKSAFYGLENIEFECDNILSVAKGALVSPANSYGFMDGGIDEEYIDFFGMDLQNAVRDRIDRLGGSLPIGSVFTINTKNEKIPYLIVAPTMELPGAVPAHNCYFAMSGILREMEKSRGKYEDVYCPGLCTGTGRVDYEAAADEMVKSYKAWLEK